MVVLKNTCFDSPTCSRPLAFCRPSTARWSRRTERSVRATTRLSSLVNPFLLQLLMLSAAGAAFLYVSLVATTCTTYRLAEECLPGRVVTAVRHAGRLSTDSAAWRVTSVGIQSARPRHGRQSQWKKTSRLSDRDKTRPTSTSTARKRRWATTWRTSGTPSTSHRPPSTRSRSKCAAGCSMPWRR